MNTDLYRGYVRLVCYEGEGGAGAGSGAGGGEGGGAGGAEDDAPKFSQKDVNKFMAEDRRKNEQKAKQQQTALEKTERTLQEALEKVKLTDQERTQMQTALEEIQTQLRTKEQQAAIDKKKLEDGLTGQLNTAKEKANYWETRYKEKEVLGALTNAAIEHKASMPGVLVDHLRGRTKLIEDASDPANTKVVVDFDDVDPNTNQPVTVQLTPSEVVKRMKDLAQYAPFFVSNAAGGVGGQGNPGTGRKADLKSLLSTPQGVDQFIQLFREKGAAAALTQ